MARCSILILAAAWIARAQTCSFTLTPPSLNVPAEENVPAPVQVTASASTCARTAVSNSPWITVSFGQSGTGNGSVGLRIDANRDPAPRTGSVTIGGVNLGVTQAAARCSFDLTPADATVPATGGSGSVAIQTTCNWTAISDATWITLTSAASGTGNGRVTFAASANNANQTRTGFIRIGTAQFRVSQPAPSCTVSIAPAQANVPATGGTGSVSVTSACSWTAASSAAWLQITSGANGSGNGTVNYTAAPNPQTQSRTGTMTIGGQPFSVSQAGAGCAISLNPAEARFATEGGSATIRVSAACAWSAATSDSWITLGAGASGTGDGSFSISASRNPGSARVGSVRVGTQTLAVQQSGAGCAVTFSPASVAVAPSGGTGTVLVSAATDCRWTVAVSAPWVSVEGGEGQGNGVVRWRAAANTTGFARTASIAGPGGSFALSQAAAIPVLSAAGIVSAASFLGGPISPGAIVAIFGSDLGGEELVTAQLTPDNAFLTKSLAGTQVFFDDLPAPMLYVIKDQLSCVVPFAVAGKPSVRVTVQHGEARSQPVIAVVALASPGLFTSNASGSGHGALRNQDQSINAVDNPARRGSVVSLYAAGAGMFEPAVADGEITGKVLAQPVLPVTVEIGGVEAPVHYAGIAPFLVAGVLQINVEIPGSIVPGAAVPVRIRVGSFPGQDGVTLAVE